MPVLCFIYFADTVKPPFYERPGLKNKLGFFSTVVAIGLMLSKFYEVLNFMKQFKRPGYNSKSRFN